MTRHLFLAAALFPSFLPGYAADKVFSESFSTAGDFGKWTVIDANGDGKTWGFADDAIPSKVFYTYDGSNNGDDWLISPDIVIPSDGSYIVRYNMAGSSYGEAMEVWSGNGDTVDDMSVRHAEHPFVGADVQGSYFLAEFSKDDIVNLGFHAVSGPDKYRLYLIDVEMAAVSDPVDLCVTEIVSPVTGEDLSEEEVTIRIANKGLVDVDVFDVCFTVDDIEAVTETVTAHLPVGGEMEYTFTAKADLSTPRGTYTLKAWTSHPDDILPANDSTSSAVRHVAPATVPYFMGFEAEEDTSGLVFLNLNEDDGDWNIAYDGFFTHVSRTGSAALCYNYNKENDADDWAILEPIMMDAGHYALKFWYSATENHPERLRVCYGNAPVPEALTNVLCEYNPVTNIDYEESISIFELKEPEKIYIGFYAFSDKDENWLLVDDISLMKIDNTSLDINLAEISAPGNYLRAANKKDVQYSVMNVGIVDADITSRLFIDGEEMAVSGNRIAAQEKKTLAFQDVLANLPTGKHSLKVTVECDKDTDLSNNAIEMDVTVVGEPVFMWDFEDGIIPSGLTYRAEDGGTVNPGAGEEFTDAGWGIFTLEHYMLGKHALALSSWLDGTDRADRWLVMPHVRVVGSEAYFLWDSNSFTLPEDYDVAISESDDIYYNYSTVESVRGDSNYPATHGISLSGYEGKDIYVAIHLRTGTSSGEALILDNLAFYGEVEEGGTVGIGSVMECGDGAIRVAGGMINVESAISIDVYSSDGIHIGNVLGNSYSMSSLSKGCYVVRANTPGGYVSGLVMK